MQSEQCLRCKHYIGSAKCDAFPEGIPEAVITGQHDHVEPYPGDNGIRFEPMKTAPKAITREDDRV